MNYDFISVWTYAKAQNCTEAWVGIGNIKITTHFTRKTNTGVSENNLDGDSMYRYFDVD